MKIASIDVFQVDLPYSGGIYRLSGGRTYENFDATVVRVTSDNGIEGWGESTPFGSTYIASHAFGVRAALELLAPSVLGMDPRHHDRINEKMDEALLGYFDAKTPIDVACWDIEGKHTEQPVCDLLGGGTGKSVPLISSIYSDSPENMRAHIDRLRKQGFRGHSIKIGASETEGGPQLDAERLKACLADRIPGEWFLADANSGMSPEQVLRLLALLPFGLDFVLEAPCASWRETLSVRQRTSRPILLDELVQSEQDLIHAISTDACDGVGLKISKQGGLTRMRRQREIAGAGGLVMSIQDTVGSEISFATILHMAQSTPVHLLRCALDPRAMVSLSVADFDAKIKDGGAIAPNAPGLGIKPKLEVLGKPVASYNV